MIDAEGGQLGIMSTNEALTKAREAGLDLVEVFPKAEPPVCRILDYGQWMYNQTKQKQKAMTKSHKSEVKGVRLTYNMGGHDLDVRVKQAQKFLGQGDRVKTEIILKGRQKAHPEKVKEIMFKFQELLGDKARVDQEPVREGNKFTALYSYKK